MEWSRHRRPPGSGRDALGASVQEITDPPEYEAAYTLYQSWPEAKAARVDATAALPPEQVTNREQAAIEQRVRDLTLSNEETWIPSTDEEYHTWRKTHPNGYVLNAPRSGAAASSKLHVLVECMHVCNHRNTKDNALTRGARKVWAERVEALRRMHLKPVLIALSLLPASLLACGKGVTPPEQSAPEDVRQPIPLTDLGRRTYLGFSGGLYPDGRNNVPVQHAQIGTERARSIRPLDAQGNPSPSGKYVLLSIGMSNTTQEFCSQAAAPCTSWSFMGQALSDPSVNHATLAVVNGAAGGQAAETWDSPTDANYNRVRDSVLAPQGLSEKQVQIAWVKVAHPNPSPSLPSAQADAYLLETSLGNIVRALKNRYPNLQQVFLSSRIYAGYATTRLNPEPYAYESGFAVKWLIQAQIEQMQAGGNITDARAGDLNYNITAPWIAWGPYLWADGTTPRSDGLVWERSDLADDGTHPSASGERRVATMLLAFFKDSPYTRCWFLSGTSCS